MKKFLVSLLILSFTCPQIGAQQQPDQKHIESIKKRVADSVDKQRSVVIETYDHRRLQGSISEAGPDSFVLNYQVQATTLEYSDVKKIKWHSQLSRQSKSLVVAAIVTGGLFALIILVGAARD
ncbi:MAG TPA: hypothetical protein VN025_02870 [Candidatus Dormibacteraeota bacterium]|jgi:hypothetical protein|nr:hypothetical protein [Candidatus Dormibacteraeota bacterium]